MLFKQVIEINNLICGAFHDLKPLALLLNIKQPVEEF